MPFYDYKCIKCWKKNEYRLSMDHEPPNCPDCGVVLKRIYTAFSIGKSELDREAASEQDILHMCDHTSSEGRATARHLGIDVPDNL